MRIAAAFASVLIVVSLRTFAQSPVQISVDTRNPSGTIPNAFSGISLEMGALRSGNGGTTGNMFDDSTLWPINFHSQVATLFRELGIKHIRVGGGSVDMDIVPSTYDIDAFFRFARMMNARVTYSVRLLKGNITDDTTTVKYIWNNYGQNIDCISIGNEPDWNSYHNQDPEIADYPTYMSKWKRFAAAITTAVPGIKFGGPDTGSNYPVPGAKSTNYIGFPWTNLFASDEKNAGIVKSIYFHNYVGQSASGTPQQMIDKMLSADWGATCYAPLYTTTAVPVMNNGFPYRLSESNSYSGYVKGGSNSFATALFALDYMHWWASHGAEGVNFHNKQWVGNGPIYLDANKNFQTYPVGYGIKAFDLGGHGNIDPLTMTNADTLNLTAYAVQDSASLYITIINKEHGSGARDANVSIAAEGGSPAASVVYLKSQNGVADTIGVTLGGAPISNTGFWNGTWLPVGMTAADRYAVTVPASSAAIVKIVRTVTSVSTLSVHPSTYALAQNYPNPFNPSTRIAYSIPSAQFVSLKVFNLLGQEVATLVHERRDAGTYEVEFRGDKLVSGVYVYALHCENFSAVRKMVFVK